MPKCLGCERVFHKTQLNEAGRCDRCRAGTPPAATRDDTKLDRVIELLDALYAVAVKVEEKLDVLVQRVQG